MLTEKQVSLGLAATQQPGVRNAIYMIPLLEFGRSSGEVALVNQGEQRRVRLRTLAYVERKAHQRVELLLAEWNVCRAINRVNGRLRVLREPLVGIVRCTCL